MKAIVFRNMLKSKLTNESHFDSDDIKMFDSDGYRVAHFRKYSNGDIKIFQNDINFNIKNLPNLYVDDLLIDVKEYE